MEMVITNDIEQLIVNGQQKIAAQIKQMDDENIEKNVLAMKEALDRATAIREKLPPAVCRYVAPSDESASIIRVPGCAEIRVEIYRDNLNFRVLEFKAGYDDWGHYVPVLRTEWERDLEIAMARARDVGEASFEKAEEEVEKRNLKEAEQSTKQREREAFFDNVLNMARDTLGDCEKGQTSMAASLLSIANTLLGIEDDLRNRP